MARRLAPTRVARSGLAAALAVWLGLGLGVGLGGPVGAQGFDPGAPEGAEQTGFRTRPFDRYALPIGAYGPQGPRALSLEGEVTMQAWRIGDDRAGTAGVVAGYEERLSDLGFSTVFECRTADCGGFDFRFAVTLLPAPAMLIDAADFHQLSMRRENEEGGSTFVSVLASRVLGTVYVQVATVEAGERATRVTPSPGIEVAPEALILPQDERSLYDRLTEKGHVRVEGLVFDTGGARLSPGSTEALDMLARLLSRNPDIAVAIVGHSDNQGSLEINIDLSRRRAEAVRDALIERGVDGGRLDAHGIGWLAPVAANATEAGRALNRRVELVLR